MTEEIKQTKKFPKLLGFISGAALATGIESLVDFYSRSDSIRDAVYSHATKIGPETIEQANTLAIKATGLGTYLIPVILFGLAGLFAVDAYLETQKK